MAKLTDVLITNVAIARAIETKFPMIPKLSTQMTTFAGQVPVGPDIPAIAITILEPPPPNRVGQPLAAFFNGPPITGPSLPGATPVTAGLATVAARLPLSPVNPGVGRGTIDYAMLPLSPANPGAARGTITYNE